MDMNITHTAHLQFLIIEIISVMIFFMGGCVLMGWIYNVPILKSMLTSWTPIQPNLAISLILSGISLWLFNKKFTKPWIHHAAYVTAVMVFILGFLTITEYIVKKNLGPDQIFIQPASVPDKIFLVAGFNFILISLALFLTDLIILRFPTILLCSIIISTSLFALFGSAPLIAIVCTFLSIGILFLKHLSLVNNSHIDTLHLAWIVESSVDSIVGLSLNGVIKSWNKASTSLYGYTADEVIGKSLPTVIISQDRHIEMDEIINKIRNNIPIVNFETIRIHKNGWLIPVSIDISPIKNAQGKIIGISEITQNNAVRKRVEQMKNDFISMVSHELRTPLTSILGSLSLLTGGITGPFTPKAHQLLNIAKQNSERLIRFINEILDIEKIESGKIEYTLKPIQLPQLLEEAVMENQEYSGVVKLKLLEPIPNILIHVDHDGFLQVIANLISNALKFSPPNSVVLIKASTQADKVEIAVSDTGPGIPEEFYKKIFQKFSQADSSMISGHSGTGLGLSISKSIIEKLNGTIHFETTLNKGTTFFVTLPIYKKIAIKGTVLTNSRG